MKPSPPPPVSQHLSAGQCLHLHLNAGDELQIVVGQARIEQPLWMAEQMIMQRRWLTAGQLYRIEHSAWVSITSLSTLEFTHHGSVHLLKALYRAIQRISRLSTAVLHSLYRKSQSSQ